MDWGKRSAMSGLISHFYCVKLLETVTRSSEDLDACKTQLNRPPVFVAATARESCSLSLT